MPTMREAGLPKWPNPGYTNCMMGTHSDGHNSGCLCKGVRNFDVEKAKKAVLKNAYERVTTLLGDAWALWTTNDWDMYLLINMENQ